ncbi:MAG: ribose 5-phosphate isomerase B [Gemmiger sp.]|uniref:ribose 5-phosphate isomerase B n=1 Tax=Gemmiger sp. TaxID=2049027 RepID=UPI002E76861E|nr:ribose 5-phosphate isomerase B [Gemmiger sp.]MEE0802035.1 ribose 5-phosphate isomerase B [Gemmiger sp.]
MAFKSDKPIALGADHGGYELKEAIKQHLTERGIAFTDYGTDSTASCDYPDYAAAACGAVREGRSDLAILCCGTGVGMSMCANKIRGIRACCCSDTFSAEFTRRHNDANALCMGGRVVGPGLGCAIVDAFLDAEFEGGRHQKRIDKMMALENL